jgi:hypothetical protein
MSEQEIPKGSPTLRIFDRARSSHAWQKAFAEMRNPISDRRWAVVSNWAMDHRVSAERESADLEASGHFKAVADAKTWWRAREIYFREEICQPAYSTSPGARISAYLGPFNRENLIQAEVAAFDQLIHVGSLNAMLRRISRGRSAGDVDAALRSLTAQGLPARQTGVAGSGSLGAGVSDLANALSSRGSEVVRQAAGILAEAMGDSEPPWWAGFAEEIESSLAQRNAGAACAALGLGHRTAGEWLLVWRYPVSAALPIYRPTAIEANDSPYHFPSPPDHPWGITMPLAAEIPACREVLHPPLRGSAAIDYSTGELLLLEDIPTFGDNDSLAALRGEHRRRLIREFSSPGLSSWLDRNADPSP